MPVRIVQSNGVVSDEIFEFDHTRRDRRGNVPLVSSDGRKRLVIHRTRILPIDADSRPVSYGDGGGLSASCPSCDFVAKVEVGQLVASCPDHGQFGLNWDCLKSTAIPHAYLPPRPKSVHKKPVPMKKPVLVKAGPQPIDFDLMLEVGEVWTKSDIDFDYDEFEVRSHTFIITSGRPRKFSFNSYNLTWGKKSRDSALAAFIADEPDDGRPVGYIIRSNIDAVRAKLVRSGYKPHGRAGSPER